ncbi:MAG: response regulator transcription factor [Bacteroidota bacterium]
MKQTILLFSGLVTAILVLLQLGRYSLISGDIRTELLIGVTAFIFLGVGLIFRNKATTVEVMSQPTPVCSPEHISAKLKDFQITEREYEVLAHIAAGRSNKEIAEQLFLSESTVKTHVSNLLSKLDSRRRTQAVERARKEGILA